MPVLASISDVFSNSRVTQILKLGSGISCAVDVTFGSWQSFLAIAVCTFWGWGLQWDSGGCMLCVVGAAYTWAACEAFTWQHEYLCSLEIVQWNKTCGHTNILSYCVEILRYEHFIEDFLWSSKRGLGCAGSAFSLGCPVNSCRPMWCGTAHLVCGEECEHTEGANTSQNCCNMNCSQSSLHSLM